MSDNERKTWIMLKKAYTIIPFSADIVPKFDSNNTGTDKYGTWKVSATWLPADLIKYGNESVKPYLYKLFDKSDSNFEISPTEASYQLTDIITLEVPDGISINPTQFYVKTPGSQGGRSGTGVIEGYNNKTGQWEQITDTFSIYSNKTWYVNTTSDGYYTKFKFTFIKNPYNSWGCNFVNEIKILSGNIRIE